MANFRRAYRPRSIHPQQRRAAEGTGPKRLMVPVLRSHLYRAELSCDDERRTQVTHPVPQRVAAEIRAGRPARPSV